MNKYEKLCMVGRGAHGIVYLCQRVDDKCKVIIKEIPVEGMTVAQRQSALVETRVLQMLSHPNIIGYYEYFIENNSLCIVMQYAEGGTMADFLQSRKGRPLEEEKVVHLFTQILLALHHVHSKQIVHRDMKTQNILLNRQRNIAKLSGWCLSLSDFGISKELMTQSKANTVVGTPQYLSPEVCAGRPYNQKSDIWALGCILYELATLRRAFEADTMPVLFDKIMRNAPASIGDHVSSDLASIVSWCLERDASRRPDTCQLLSHPVILLCALQLATDLGTLPCPRSLKEPITPINSKKLKTRADSKNSTVSPQGASSAVQGGTCKVLLLKDNQTHELNMHSNELEIRQTSTNGEQHFAVTDCGTLIVWNLVNGVYESQHMRTANVVSVAVGHSFYMLVNDQGMLYSWGRSERGCLGLGPNIDHVQQPAVVDPLITYAVTRVACAQAHVLALTDDHKLYAWGDNQYGQLGLSVSTYGQVSSAVQVQLDARAQIHSIHCTHHASAVVLTDGTVWAAGCNRFNKLGLSSDTNIVKQADHFRPSSLPSVNLQLPQPFSLGVQHTALIHEHKVYIMGCMSVDGAEAGAGAGEACWLKEPLVWEHRPCRVAAGYNCTYIVASDQRVFVQRMSSHNRPVISVVHVPQLDVLRREVLHMKVHHNQLLCAVKVC